MNATATAPTLTAPQLEAALGRLGLDAVAAATALGVSVRTVYAWLGGTRPVAGPVVRLLEYMERDRARRTARARRRARNPRRAGGQGKDHTPAPAGSTGRPGGAT